MVVGAMNLNRYVPGERPVRQAEHPYSHCLLSGIALYTMEEISFSTQHKKINMSTRQSFLGRCKQFLASLYYKPPKERNFYEQSK